MKIYIEPHKLTINGEESGLSRKLETITDKATVRETEKGFTVAADPVTLYGIIYELSKDFDIDIV